MSGITSKLVIYMGAMKTILRWIISLNDWWFHKQQHCILIPYCENEFFYMSTHPYKGKQRTLKNGIVIQPGDMIIELHVNNQITGDVNNLKIIVKAMKESMIALSKTVTQLPEYKEVKAIYGMTLLYPIAQRYGYEVIESQEIKDNKKVRLWENLIKYAYSDAKEIVSKRDMKEIWFAVPSLIAKYGEK